MNDTTRLIRDLEGQGFEVSMTGGNHWKVLAPGGGFTFISYTPSDARSVKNSLSRLRRLGYEDRQLQGKGKKRKKGR